MNREHMERASSREVLEQSTAIGCYNCLALYEEGEVVVSDTSKCPRCNSATLVGDAGVADLSRSFLVSLKSQYLAR